MTESRTGLLKNLIWEEGGGQSWFELRKACLPYLIVPITFKSRAGLHSSICESLSLQKSAAFWPPWPSKTAKQALDEAPWKQSLTKNYRKTIRLVLARKALSWESFPQCVVKGGREAFSNFYFS